MSLADWMGMIAAVVMPLWNIPLIVKIEQRKSSRDISMPWALGIFGCLVMMLPSGFSSPDPVFRLFAILNVIFFGAVVFQVVRYR